MKLLGPISTPMIRVKRIGVGTVTYILPTADGTSGQFLKTLGNGQLAWANVDVGDNAVFNEIPTGAINGSNTVYTLAAAYIATTTRVYLNGLRLLLGAGNDYTESGSGQITINYAPESGDVLLVDYQQS